MTDPTLAPATEQAVERALAEHAKKSGALLVVLHAIQDSLGYVPKETVPRIADALTLSRAEVEGVISFYRDFRTAPPGKRVVRLCRAEACQAVGATELARHAADRLSCAFGETSARSVTLEAVYCLGNCACGPSLMVDGALFGRVTTERFDELLRAEIAK